MNHAKLPTQTVVVDLSAVRGVPTYKASGFIWCFTPDGLRPGDAIAAPLRIQKIRCSPARIRSWYPRLCASNIRAQMVLSDGWRDLTGNARWPGDGDAWDEWESFCADLVRLNRVAGITAEYDIVNEPDNKGFWTPTYERFLEAWKRGYRAVRSVDPNAVVCGPSWTGTYPSTDPCAKFNHFLSFCKDNAVVPDIITWHFPRNVEAEADACIGYLSRIGVTCTGLEINEYVGESSAHRTPGSTAYQIGGLERSRITSALHAIWTGDDKGDFDGMLADPINELPNGQWWVYKRYAEMDGVLFHTVRSETIDLCAGGVSGRNGALIMLGNDTERGFSGNVTVVVRGFSAFSEASGNEATQVRVERIPHDDGAAVNSLPIVDNQVQSINADHIAVDIPWSDARDAYAIGLSCP